MSDRAEPKTGIRAARVPDCPHAMQVVTTSGLGNALKVIGIVVLVVLAQRFILPRLGLGT